METTAGTTDVVRAYHDAWTSKNFEQAAMHLAPDLETDVPINTYATAEEFVEALSWFGQLVLSVDLLAEFARGDQAMLLYDVVTDPFGRLRVAEHFTVAGGRITRIRHVHDTAALRAAGLGEDDS